MAIFLINGILTLYALSPDENEYFLVHEFLTPALLVSICFFSYTLSVIKNRWVLNVGILLMLSLLAFKYYDQHQNLYMRDNTYASKLATDSLIILPEKAVIIGETDYTLFSLYYLQNVQGLRKDVVVLDADFFMLPWYQEQNVKRLPFLKDLLPNIMSHTEGKAPSKIDMAALENFKLNQTYLLAKNIKDKLKSDVFFTYDFAEMARLYRPDIAMKLAPFGTLYKLCINEAVVENYPPYDLKPFLKSFYLPSEEAIYLTPYLPYLFKEAEIAYVNGDFGSAARLFEKIYAVKPDIYNAATLVILLAEEGKKLKYAEKLIDGIIDKLTVPDPKIHLAKAVVSLKMKRYDDAVKILSFIDSNYPQVCEASYYLLEALKGLGEKEKSKQVFSRVMERCNDFYKRRALLLMNEK